MRMAQSFRRELFGNPRPCFQLRKEQLDKSIGIWEQGIAVHLRPFELSEVLTDYHETQE
jgi:hypothetical protein